jgi:hypothetical protein
MGNNFMFGGVEIKKIEDIHFTILPILNLYKTMQFILIFNRVKKEIGTLITIITQGL